MIDIEKMSRKETIRALRACGTLGGTCSKCPMNSKCPLNEAAQDLSFDCANELLRHAADVLEASVSVQYE